MALIPSCVSIDVKDQHQLRLSVDMDRKSIYTESVPHLQCNGADGAQSYMMNSRSISRRDRGLLTLGIPDMTLHVSGSEAVC